MLVYSSVSELPENRIQAALGDYCFPSTVINGDRVVVPIDNCDGVTVEKHRGGVFVIAHRGATAPHVFAGFHGIDHFLFDYSHGCLFGVRD